MRSSALLAVASAILSTSVSALVVTKGSPLQEEKRQGFCLNYYEAQVIANDFASLISNYNATFANIVLADDYTDQSDSVNTLIDSGTESPIPLGALTFASKAAFLAGQGSQPNIPFEILDLWFTCDTVIIRWVSAMVPQQVQGFDALIVEPAAANSTALGPYKIKTTYGEFNSGAWLADLGRPECNTTAATR